MSRVVLIYCRADAEIARQFGAGLRSMGHIILWPPDDWLLPGNWQDLELEAISRADAAIVFESEVSDQRPTHATEIAFALTTFRVRGYGLLIPINVRPPGVSGRINGALADFQGYRASNMTTDELVSRLHAEITSSTNQRFDVFLSYASDDSDLAQELKTDLTSSGLTCFMASKDIRASQLWQDEIRQALLHSECVLVLITPNSKDRPWVLIEVGAAWISGKAVFPALLYVKVNDLPEALSKHQSLNIETRIQREMLIKQICEIKSASERTPW